MTGIPEPNSEPPRHSGSGMALGLVILSGLLLLGPGLCALVFMGASGARDLPRDGFILRLWSACIAISAVGVVMIVRAVLHYREQEPSKRRHPLITLVMVIQGILLMIAPSVVFIFLTEKALDSRSTIAVAVVALLMWIGGAALLLRSARSY